MHKFTESNNITSNAFPPQNRLKKFRIAFTNQWWVQFIVENWTNSKILIRIYNTWTKICYVQINKSSTSKHVLIKFNEAIGCKEWCLFYLVYRRRDQVIPEFKTTPCLCDIRPIRQQLAISIIYYACVVKVSVNVRRDGTSFCLYICACRVREQFGEKNSTEPIESFHRSFYIFYSHAA